MGERLPFQDADFAADLLVTVICFVQDVQLLLTEAARVIRPGGSLVGRLYRPRERVGLRDLRFRQTILPLAGAAVLAVEEGYGRGSFVAIGAAKENRPDVLPA